MNESTSSPAGESVAAPGAETAPLSVVPVRPAWYARIGPTQMVLAVLALVFLWQWLDEHRAISAMREQLAAKLAEMDGRAHDSQVLAQETQTRLQVLADKLAALEAGYADSLNQRAALEALYNDLSANRDETLLAEIEQMLLVAAQQLQLSANVKAALIALQSADSRLQRSDRPAFNGLRKVIGQDMEKLRVLPEIDIPGIGFQLDALAARADTLPLMYQRRHGEMPDLPAAAEAAPSAWRRVLHELWQELRQLIRIENTGKAEIPLLPPEQAFFLRENLKLRLMSARLALLSRDQANFRHELQTAEGWVARYFDTASAEGRQMQADLKALSSTSVGIELPDIHDSLQAVRNFRQSLDKAAK